MGADTCRYCGAGPHAQCHCSGRSTRCSSSEVAETRTASDSGVKCPRNHSCSVRSGNPRKYLGVAVQCDICGTAGLDVHCAYFYHCSVCCFDICPSCGVAASAAEARPIASGNAARLAHADSTDTKLRVCSPTSQAEKRQLQSGETAGSTKHIFDANTIHPQSPQPGVASERNVELRFFDPATDDQEIWPRAGNLEGNSDGVRSAVSSPTELSKVLAEAVSSSEKRSSALPRVQEEPMQYTTFGEMFGCGMGVDDDARRASKDPVVKL